MKTITVILILLVGVGIVFWRSNMGSDALIEVSLPGDVGTVSIPTDFTTEYEDDSTLLAYPQGLECISLRFTSISFTKNDGSENGGIAHLRRKSKEENIPLQEYPEKVAVSYEKESTQDGTPLLMKYWEVGSKNTILIVSATVIPDLRSSRRVKRTLKLMPEIIRSVTITKLHRTVEDDGKRVEATVKTVEPSPQKIELFSSAANRWRSDNLVNAKQLSSKYGIEHSNTPCLSGKRAYLSWRDLIG